jgi:hypothetical protein
VRHANASKIDAGSSPRLWLVIVPSLSLSRLSRRLRLLEA